MTTNEGPDPHICNDDCEQNAHPTNEGPQPEGVTHSFPKMTYTEGPDPYALKELETAERALSEAVESREQMKRCWDAEAEEHRITRLGLQRAQRALEQGTPPDVAGLQRALSEAQQEIARLKGTE